MTNILTLPLSSYIACLHCPHNDIVFVGSWIHPKEREKEDRKAAEEKQKSSAPPVIPIASSPPSSPATPNPVSNSKTVSKRDHAPKQQRRSRLSTTEKEELQNVKQLCLSVMKGQKRLVRELGIVKNSIQNASIAGVDYQDGVSRKGSSEDPEVSIKDIRDIEIRQQKNLKAHLIALDMKEQGNLSSWREGASCLENQS